MANSDAENSADNFSLRLLGHNLVCNRIKRRPYPPVELNFFPADPEPLIPLKASCKPLTPAVQPSAHEPAATGAGEGEGEAVVVDQERGGGDRGRRKKRPRLTAVQRGRVLEYAERVGWSVRKSDEGRMMELCGEIGISHQRCINWINNHRNKIGSAAD